MLSINCILMKMKLQASILIFCLFVILSIVGCASGSVILTGTARSPVDPEQVKIYLEPPSSFEVIALVSASSSSGLTEQGSVDYAIAELKRRAAKVGANGVLLLSTGESTKTTINGYGTDYAYISSSTKKNIQGKAIFVENP